MTGRSIYERIFLLIDQYGRYFHKEGTREMENGSLVVVIDAKSYSDLLDEISKFMSFDNSPLADLITTKKMKFCDFVVDVVVEYSGQERVDVLWRKFLLP